MLFYKIFIDNSFDSNQFMSNRPLIRGFEQTGATDLIKDGIPFIVVYIDEELFVRELFTGEYIKENTLTGLSLDQGSIFKFNDLAKYRTESIDKPELYRLLALKKNPEFIKALKMILFNKENDIQVSTKEDLAEDRAKQFEAYENNQTSINPYTTEYINSKILRYRR